MDPLFIKAIPVIEKIEENGFEAFFVGGSVRDLILKRDIHDIDIATQANPEEVKEIFNHTFDIGIEHGTVLVRLNGQNFEVTTYRAESTYIDFRRPSEVVFIRSLKDDLERRDFTMNAMAMSKDWEIIDPFNGRKAIEHQLIETVGNPKDRFSEDALRIMRAVRFVSQLGFKVENQTMQALEQYAQLLKNIAVERITMEMEKLLSGKYKAKALKMIEHLHLYEVFPAIINKQSLEYIKKLEIETLTEEEMWVLFLFANAKDVESQLKLWRLSTKKIRFLKKSLAYLQKRMDNEWTTYDLYNAQEEVIVVVEHVYQVLTHHKFEDVTPQLLQIYNQLPIKQQSELAVSGRELMEWKNMRGGPWLKQLLLEIEQAVVAGKLTNDEITIRRWVEHDLN